MQDKGTNIKIVVGFTILVIICSFIYYIHKNKTHPKEAVVIPSFQPTPIASESAKIDEATTAANK